MEKTDKTGEVHIADEVLLVIAGLAATEVEGVRALEGGITRDRIPTSTVKALSKSIKVTVNGSTVKVKVSLILAADSSIPVLSRSVQEKVADAIESMAGLKTESVDITISGVEL